MTTTTFTTEEATAAYQAFVDSNANRCMTAIEGEGFALHIAQIKANRQENAVSMAKAMYAKLDHETRHRNYSDEQVMKLLRRHYLQFGDHSGVTVERWNEAFSIWSPYTGTY